MTVPKTIDVGPYRYRVVVDGDAIARVSVADGAPALAGHHDPAAQVITIDPALGPDAMAETLLHEVLHASLEQVPNDLTTAEEEGLVLGLGFVVLDVLRKNPALVTFLTARRSTRAR